MGGACRSGGAGDVEGGDTGKVLARSLGKAFGPSLGGGHALRRVLYLGSRLEGHGSAMPVLGRWDELFGPPGSSAKGLSLLHRIAKQQQAFVWREVLEARLKLRHDQ